MKKFIYALAGLLALGVTSCKDDDSNYSTDDLDRLPMTMFRCDNTTNKNEDGDPYSTKLVPGTLNVAQLYWYGVEGACGYQIRYAENLNSGLLEDWDDPSKICEDFVVGPDVLNIRIPRLNYKTDYRFCIRALSPKGEKYHSKWYGLGGGREWEYYKGIGTLDRYVVPGICGNRDKDYHSFVFTYKLDYNPSEFTAVDNDTIQKRFDIEDGKFVVTTVVLKPAPFNPNAACPFREHVLTEEEKAAGELLIEGLDENSGYYITLRNDARIDHYKDFNGNDATSDIDAEYNQVFVRTKGDPGDPIIVAPYVDPNDTIRGAVEYNATRLDTILANFVNDNTLAEGQTFYLAGGHNYYFTGNPQAQKGFTLATDPADLAQGKRAVVYMDGIAMNGETPRTGNWMFGKNKEAGDVDAPVEVQDMIFENIDFQCPLARNFGAGSASGNYFANMYSGGLAVTFESLQFKGCTFQGFVRGFFRVQGSRYKIFKKILVEDCLFYNNGYYDNNGAGYAWFAGDGGHVKSNIFMDIQIRNCTFYDSPRVALFTDNNKSLSWGEDHKGYHFTVENCTFINLSTRTSGRNFFNMRYLPDNSSIVFKNNLICLAADPSDGRALHNCGADVREVAGLGRLTLDIRDNYSLGCRDEHMKDDGIWTASAFSAAKNAFGDKWDWEPGLVTKNKEDLVVKVGEPALRTDEFFMNPNPKNKNYDAGVPSKFDHAAPDNIFDALKVNTASLKVTEHEIYKKRIGDKRWYE